MQIQIEDQIPTPIKMFSNHYIAIPKNIRNALNWKGGDMLSIYATKKGIFLKKEEK